LTTIELNEQGQVGSTPSSSTRLVRAAHHELGEYWLACEGVPELLYTENESNAQRLWGVENRAPFVKDGINDTVVNRAEGRLNPQGVGTKVAVHYPLVIVPDETKTVLLRLSANPQSMPFAQAW